MLTQGTGQIIGQGSNQTIGEVSILSNEISIATISRLPDFFCV